MERHERLAKAIDFLKEQGVVRLKMEVAEKIGLDKSNLSRALKGESRYLTDKMLTRFNNAFNNVFSLEWLLNDEGDWLAHKLPKDVNDVLFNGSPYYNIYVSELGDLQDPKDFDFKVDYKPLNSATMWCKMSGDSMSPKINHGDAIAIRRISDFGFIAYGETYVIEMKNGVIVVRNITKAPQEGMVRLVAENSIGGCMPQDVELSAIEKVYLVLGLLRKL